MLARLQRRIGSVFVGAFDAARGSNIFLEIAESSANGSIHPWPINMYRTGGVSAMRAASRTIHALKHATEPFGSGQQPSAEALKELGRVLQAAQHLAHLSSCVSAIASNRIASRALKPLHEQLAKSWAVYLKAVRRAALKRAEETGLEGETAEREVVRALCEHPLLPSVACEGVLQEKTRMVMKQLEEAERAYARAYMAIVTPSFQVSREHVGGPPSWSALFVSFRDRSKCVFQLDRLMFQNILGQLTRQQDRQRALKMHMDAFQQQGGAAVRALLQVLRLRKRVAQQEGYRSWHEYAAARRLLEPTESLPPLFDAVYSALQPLVRAVQQSAAVMAAGSTRRVAGGPLGVVGAQQQQQPPEFAEWIHAAKQVTQQSREIEVALLYYEKRALHGAVEAMAELYGLRLRAVKQASLVFGWDHGFAIYRADDIGTGQRLGYLYFQGMQTWRWRHIFRRTQNALSGTTALAPGHVCVMANLPSAGPMRSRGLDVGEVRALMHELGHAAHLLLAPKQVPSYQCMSGALDMLETPSTFLELCMRSGHVLPLLSDDHVAKREMSADLARVGRPNVLNALSLLQASYLDFALHSPMFDPDTATTDDLLQFARRCVQRYCPATLPEEWHLLSADTALHLAYKEAGVYVGYLLAFCRAGCLFKQLDGSKEPFDQTLAARIKTDLLGASPFSPKSTADPRVASVVDGLLAPAFSTAQLAPLPTLPPVFGEAAPQVAKRMAGNGVGSACGLFRGASIASYVQQIEPWGVEKLTQHTHTLTQTGKAAKSHVAGFTGPLKSQQQQPEHAAQLQQQQVSSRHSARPPVAGKK